MIQWIDKAYKDICQELMPAILPLFTKRKPGAIQYSWAILDFVTIAGYMSHIKEILQYMSHVLMRIDKTKQVFKDIYCNNA